MLLTAGSLAVNAQDRKHKSPVTNVIADKTLVKTDDGVELQDGNCTVFEIKIDNGGDQRVDARMVTTLFFEIPSDQSSFEYTEKDFESKSAYILISECRCMDRGYNLVTKGYIRGSKLKNGNWKIESDVVAMGKDSQQERSFSFSDTIPASTK